MSATVIDLDDYKQSLIRPHSAVAFVRDGMVVVQLPGAEIELSPASAATWALGLITLAATARQEDDGA